MSSKRKDIAREASHAGSWYTDSGEMSVLILLVLLILLILFMMSHILDTVLMPQFLDTVLMFAIE